MVGFGTAFVMVTFRTAVLVVVLFGRAVGEFPVFVKQYLPGACFRTVGFRTAMLRRLS